MDLIYRFDPHDPIKLPKDLDAQGVIELLQDGNARFVDLVETLQKSINGEKTAASIVVPQRALSPGLPIIPGLVPTQSPFALVIGCSDARVPIEIVFDQFFNGMFVVRIAGNALSTEGLGSIQYAVKSLSHSLRLGLVLGHTGCGAMTAAVDSYLHPHDYIEIGFSHSLRSLIDRAMMAVRGAHRAIKAIPETISLNPAERREVLIELTVYLNAALTSYQLQQEVRLMDAPDMRICYGVYDLGDGHVRSAPKSDDQYVDGPAEMFATPPDSPAAFVEIAKGWVLRILSRRKNPTGNQPGIS